MMKIKTLGCVVLLASVMVLSLATVPEVASAYIATEENEEFRAWTVNISSVMILLSDIQVSAIENQDYEQQYYCHDARYQICENALVEIDQFAISPEMQPFKDELKISLIYSQQAAHYGKRWVTYAKDDDFDKYVMYEELSSEHLEAATDVASKIFTSTSSSEIDSDGDGVPDEYDYAPNDADVQTKADVETPGFGVIFAIGSLLVVAFGLRRRRDKI